jgi:hypothetical protein
MRNMEDLMKYAILDGLVKRYRSNHSDGAGKDYSDSTLSRLFDLRLDGHSYRACAREAGIARSRAEEDTYAAPVRRIVDAGLRGISGIKKKRNKVPRKSPNFDLKELEDLLVSGTPWRDIKDDGLCSQAAYYRHKKRLKNEGKI